MTNTNTENLLRECFALCNYAYTGDESELKKLAVMKSPEFNNILQRENDRLATLLEMQEQGIAPSDCHPSWKKYFEQPRQT